MESYKHFASLLGVPPEVLKKLEKKLAGFTGGELLFLRIAEEMEQRIERIFAVCGLQKEEKSAQKITEAFKRRLIEEEKKLEKILYQPKFSSEEGCRTLLNVTREISGAGEGFYLKEEKAKELLTENPPRRIMKLLGYQRVEELLDKESVWEIFAALRFIEDREWLNSEFFRPYAKLQKEDFERRPIKTVVLPARWVRAGAYYVGKKLHHVSHLKELGLIFILPFENHYAGSLFEIFTLVLHYFHEVAFYARLFTQYAQAPSIFGQNIVKALSGQVVTGPLPEKDGFAFRVVQRYLAKENADDPRLYEPHVNPEAFHWARAVENVAKFGERFDDGFLSLFPGGDFVGEFYPHDDCCSALISFDLIDNVISLTKESGIHNLFSYHQHEGLWNKLFEVYLGREKLEQLIVENLDRGYITLKS